VSVVVVDEIKVGFEDIVSLEESVMGVLLVVLGDEFGELRLVDILRKEGVGGRNGYDCE